MKRDEFRKDKSGAYAFDLYAWRKKARTEIGSFLVEVVMEDQEPLTDQLVEAANELVTVGSANCDTILSIAHQSYLLVRQNDSHWIEICGVPLDVEKKDVMKYVNHRAFSIRSNPKSRKKFDSVIHLIPDWDDEHSLYIRVTGNKLTPFDPMSG
jgi:hypothetical protein